MTGTFASVVSSLGIAMQGAVTQNLESRPEFNFSYQQVFINGIIAGNRKTEERFHRLHLEAEQGNWQATASYWGYPFCYWYDIDETHLKFTEKNQSIRVGRFRIPVGMSTWDDQWYSPFVFLPSVETYDFRGQKIFARTVAGVETQQNFGANQVNLSASSGEWDHNRIFPTKLRRISVRFSRFDNGTTYGLSGFANTDTSQWEQMAVADIRKTIPHFIFRAEALNYRSATQNVTGWFTEVQHRPPNWQDVTLAGRWEVLKTSNGRRELTTIGARF